MNEIPSETMELIRSHILQGEKILACKVYMEATGSSLLEAKNQVELLTEELRQRIKYRSVVATTQPANE